MKKLLAITLSMALSMGTAAYASPEEDFWALQANAKMPTAAHMKADITISAQKLPSLIGITALDDVHIGYEIKLDLADDLSSMNAQMNMTMDLPDNFPTGAQHIEQDSWSVMSTQPDGTSDTTVMTQLDQEGQFMVVKSYSPINLQGLLVPEMFAAIQQNAVESLKNNSVLTYEDGYYILTLNEQGAKQYFTETIGDLLAQMPQTPSPIPLPPLDEIFAKLADIKLFAQDAITMKYQYDGEQPKYAQIKLNFETDISDLANAFMGQPLPGDENTLVASIDVVVDFLSYNQPLELEIPTLTPANSITLDLGTSILGGNTVNVVEGSTELVEFDDDCKPFIADGVTYLPLRRALNMTGVENDRILWDNGIVTFDVFGDNFQLEVGSASVMNEGSEIVMEAPLLMQNDYTYAPVQLLDIIDYDYEYDEFTMQGEIIGSYVNMYSQFIEFPG